MEQQENDHGASPATGNDEGASDKRVDELEKDGMGAQEEKGTEPEKTEIAAVEPGKVDEASNAEDLQGAEQPEPEENNTVTEDAKGTTVSEAMLPAEPEKDSKPAENTAVSEEKDTPVPEEKDTPAPEEDTPVPEKKDAPVLEENQVAEETAVEEAGTVPEEKDSADDATKEAATAAETGEGAAAAPSVGQAKMTETGPEVPALMRQAQPPPDAAYEAGMQHKQAAEAAVAAATREAEAAVLKTATLAAASGFNYNPPSGVNVDLRDINPVDQRALEAQAQAVRNDLIRRQQAAAAARTQAQQDAQAAAARESQPTTSTAMAERSNATRRAAASKAAQSFKQVAQAEDERDFLPSPPDSPVRKAAKSKRPASAKKTDSFGASQNQQGRNSPKEGVEAWEDTPPKQLVLKPTDITRQLQNKWLQVYWPDDGRWWPGQVAAIDLRRQVMTLLYETGEQETDLDLMDMIKKGEVAWLNASDAPKKAAAPPPPAARNKSAGPKGGVRRQDSFGDDPIASSSGRRRAPVRYMEEDDEDEEDPEFEAEANIATKGRNARSTKARSRPEPEEEIESDSDTPPPSDQSSDWHSSDDDDRPRKKKKKTNKKKGGPQGGMQRQQYPAQPMHQQHMASAYGGHPQQQRGNFYGQDPFAAFGAQRGGPPGNVRMSAQHGMPGSGGYAMDHGWNVVTGQGPRDQQALLGSIGGGWNPQQDMTALLQAQAARQQQQQAFPGAGGSRFAAIDLLQARGQPNPVLQVGPGAWPNRQMPNPSAGLADWAQRADMSRGNAAGMYRPQQLAQMTMDALGGPVRSAAGSPGMAPGPDSNAQPQGQSQADRQQSMANGMGALLALGPNAAGRQVTVFQARTNVWTKATVLACMNRGGQGSALVEYDDGQQDQLPAAQEGVTFRVRLMPENAN